MNDLLKSGATAIAALVPLAVGLFGLPTPQAPTASELTDTAVASFKAKDTLEAVKTLERAIALDEKDFHTRYVAGLVAAETKRPNEAYAQLRHAHALKPDDVDAALALGVLSHNMGKQAEADAMYDAVLKLDPRNAKATYNKAQLAAETRQYAVSKRYFERYLALDPKVADAEQVKEFVRRLDARIRKGSAKS